jgi:hypothetical protein
VFDISVEVEVDDLLDIFITSTNKLIQKTLDDLCLTTSSKTNQLWAMTNLDHLFHQVGE